MLSNIRELITYYKSHDLPGLSAGWRLVNPIKRPAWILNRNLLSKSDKVLGRGNFCGNVLTSYAVYDHGVSWDFVYDYGICLIYFAIFCYLLQNLQKRLIL